MNDSPYNSEAGDPPPASSRTPRSNGPKHDIALPPGLKTKLLHADPAMFRNARNIFFPPGYIEPRHTHKGWHCVPVVKGRMCVDGKDIRPGDYDEPHGPFGIRTAPRASRSPSTEDMRHLSSGRLSAWHTHGLTGGQGP